MGELRRMEPGEGDKLLAEWDVKDETSVGVSKEQFNEMMGKKTHFAYKTDGNGGMEHAPEFDQSAETIVFVPHGQGG